MNYLQILENHPFQVEKDRKREILEKRLRDLTEFHYYNCPEYQKILDFLDYPVGKKVGVEFFPFIPVRLFKDFDLKSVPKEKIVKTMMSSGTTGQKVSKIHLDKETALNQQKTLVQIMSDFIPEMRMPMLIIDTERIIKDRNYFSARKAGVIGFSLFGKEKAFVLDENMQLNLPIIEEVAEKYKDRPILAFGYTYMVWQHLYEELRKKGKRLDLNNLILIHGGGWKKLKEKNISQEEFRAALYESAGISKVYDFYGMVEQTGSIYMSCEYDNMHASSYSEILIRRAKDFSLCEFGERGVIQLISLLPQSYPGHNILTEDEGVLLGEDDCPCGRKGKYFKILGRIKEAEIRGCSDTYES